MADREALPTAATVAPFDRDFTAVGVEAATPLVGQHYGATSCPVFPRTCPFGGACHTCPARVQAKRIGGREQEDITQAPPIVHEVLRSPGQSLEPATRAFMEPRLGHDFSGVRVHTDAKAAESARAVNALAYTVGREVVFGAGQYAPGTREGRRLLTHELAHVVQQADQAVSSPTDLAVGDVGDVYEHEAEASVDRVAKERVPTDGATITLQRSPKPVIMRAHIFTSTMEICRWLLKSRVFHVSQGGVVVTANAGWEASREWQGTERPRCGREVYNMTLNKKRLILDGEYGTCDFAMRRPVSHAWTNLPEGDYYLTIWTLNTNPNCCLRGDIEVSQQRGLSGETCTRPPPGPLEILHTALDVAGLIPALGAVPDAINAAIYAIEGDWTNAGLSAVAIIPIFGDAASVARVGRRTVVRVTGEAVERVGRDRIAAGLREARASRRAVAETTEEVTEEGLRRRGFAQRNPPIADPTLPPGTGRTDRFGNITYSSAGSATDQALTRYHEQVHSFLSPRLNRLRSFRADLMMAGYQRSAFLRYLEEALAETYAQLRVHGIRGLPTGLRFPIRNGYVTLRAVVTEAAIGTVLYGGATYGVYIWASQESAPARP
jgi:hypothetical protein